MSAANSENSEIEFQLTRLLSSYGELLFYHQWPSEHDRWVELLFALAAYVSDKRESDVRDAIQSLDGVRLVDVETLSAVPEANGGADFEHPTMRRIVEELLEREFNQEEAIKIGSIARDAAISLRQHHGGKIQRYLRAYGERMIAELSEHFSIAGMNEAQLQQAFAYWLQNVLNMPVNLETSDVKEFCRRLDVSTAELVEQADKQNINLALLDDLISQRMAEIKEKVA